MYPFLGYTSVTDEEFESLNNEVALTIAEAAFGVNNITDNQFIAAKRVVKAVASFLGTQWVVPYAFADLRLTALVAEEFMNVYEPVTCSPLGEICVYQWGYMKKYHMNYSLSESTVYR